MVAVDGPSRVSRRGHPSAPARKLDAWPPKAPRDSLSGSYTPGWVDATAGAAWALHADHTEPMRSRAAQPSRTGAKLGSGDLATDRVCERARLAPPSARFGRLRIGYELPCAGGVPSRRLGATGSFTEGRHSSVETRPGCNGRETVPRAVRLCLQLTASGGYSSLNTTHGQPVSALATTSDPVGRPGTDPPRPSRSPTQPGPLGCEYTV